MCALVSRIHLTDRREIPLTPRLRAETQYPTITRTASTYNPLHTFNLAKGAQKHYQQQYADMYFVRLAELKPVVETIAQEAWEDFEVIVTGLALACTIA